MGKLNTQMDLAFCLQRETFNSPMGKLNFEGEEIQFPIKGLSIPLWVS